MRWLAASAIVILMGWIVFGNQVAVVVGPVCAALVGWWYWRSDVARDHTPS
ncbi:MAG TPA: hypothetical protein VFR41_09085 [Acidimicrobiia bacterium]|nr:hypothetical protein [Acidimicrobiia bacterium]